LIFPVSVGRSVVHAIVGRTNVHELHTIAAGLYMSWLCVRVGTLLSEWLPQGSYAIYRAFHYWACILIKCLVVGVAVVVLIPLMFGLLFQLVVITPIRVQSNQTPLFYPWQDWALGVLQMKILSASVMMGPEWRIKRVFDRLFQDGIRNLSVTYVYKELVFPVVMGLALTLAVPYVLAHSVLSLYGVDEETEMNFQRQIYPCLLLMVLLCAFFIWQFQQIKKLITHIRNEKYLVGQRLLNYPHRQPTEPNANEEN